MNAHIILETSNADVMLFELANNINSKDYDSKHYTAHVGTENGIKCAISTQEQDADSQKSH